MKKQLNNFLIIKYNNKNYLRDINKKEKIRTKINKIKLSTFKDAKIISKKD